MPKKPRDLETEVKELKAQVAGLSQTKDYLDMATHVHVFTNVFQPMPPEPFDD